MIRVLAFVAVIAGLALGAVWMDDHPGTVSVVWLGRRIDTSVAVALIGILVASAALMIVWSLMRLVLRAPGLMVLARRTRRRAKGYDIVSRGMVAVGSGDPGAARRYSGEARKLLGEEPLTLLLEAQAAQLSGDRAAAEAAFRRMTEAPQTKLLGLRGLFIEAKRRNDAESARRLSSEAVQLAPAAGWANEAILMDRTAEGDFAGARAALERAERLRIIDKTTGARQRAVLITAEAHSLADGPRWSEACDLAVEASRLAPDLVPASVLAGKLLAQRGDLKKAAKILEASWKASPHPDTAVVYVNLRTGDSTQDKLTRARNLARIQPRDPESALAIATSALEARDFAAARSALVDLAESQPTRRVCLLMARIEEAEGQAQGRVKSWLARASRARRDPAWVADGFVSDAWAPVSPATGRLDAFVWMAPPEQVRALAEAPDDVLADGHEAQVIDVAPEIEAELAPSAALQPKPVTPAANPEPPAAANEASPPVGAEAAEKPAKPFVASVRPLPVVFPAPRAPDDPGSETAVAPASTPEMSARLRNHG